MRIISTCHPKIPHRAHGVCRRCYARAYARQPHIKQQRHERYLANKDKHNQQMRQWRIDKGLVAVSGECAICSKHVEKLNRDHNHTTRQLRGKLCSPCNLLVGLAEQNPSLLGKVAEYIEFWKTAGFPNGFYTRG